MVFKVTEADLGGTFVPQVSVYKLGRVEKVISNAEGPCLLALELRQDFMFSADEET